MDIAGNTAIITGSTGKLGSEIALALAEAGCDCICHYNTNSEFASELAAKIAQLGQKAMLVQADLADCSQLDRLFQDLPTANILTNSASVFESCSLGEIGKEYAQNIFDINVLAPLMLSKKFVSRLCGSQRSKPPFGKIINIADVAGKCGWKDYSIYCATKAALISMTKSLAKELSPGITVNSISPGIVEWPDEIKEDEVENQVSKIPMGRFARADEITSAVKFVMENDYLTGQDITLDGGRYI